MSEKARLTDTTTSLPREQTPGNKEFASQTPIGSRQQAAGSRQLYTG